MPKPVRRTQSISPFGVAAMVDFPGPVSLIHCGLDVWPFDEGNPDHYEFRIEDESRLSKRLGVEYFVLPPDYRYAQKGKPSDDKNLYLRLPFLRFPKWHTCPRCGLLYEAELHDKTAPVCKGPIGSGKDRGKPHPPRNTVQVRFVAVCEKGHIQDFPWWEWVFDGSSSDRNGKRLRYVSSGSASLAGVRIDCEEVSSGKVIQSKTLSGAFEQVSNDQNALSSIGVRCSGHNPALAIPSKGESPPGCGELLQPLLRGGSNVYFPRVVSSIYLPTIDPDIDESILTVLDNPRVWSFIQLMSDTQDGVLTIANAEAILNKYYPELEVSASELMKASNARLNPDTETGEDESSVLSDEEEYRYQEYLVFNKDISEGYPKTNLLIHSKDINFYEDIVSQYVERVSLVHKLRETRAFVGFSRVYPSDNLSDEERLQLIMSNRKEWLPAIIVRGEGIFLKLREDKIDQWLNTHESALEQRIGNMQQIFDQLNDSRRVEYRAISPKFVLLHTLAHLIINELVYECGYGSASLRERLYCSDGDKAMSGILIYTAAGDTEGTMGGLVRMGNVGAFEQVLRRALESAKWCSSDPVCIESAGQGPDNCNLAACHACALLPETSCEEGNRLLDRGLVVGTLEEPQIGYFNQ